MSEMEGKLQFSSIKQLKLNLKETLKNSGVLDTVKAQIRQEFINNLTAPSKDKSNKVKLFDIRERMVLSLIFDLLKNRKLLNTISVFLAECGIDSSKSSLLSDNDIINLIKFNSISNSYKNINDQSYEGKIDLMVSEELISKKRTSILDVIIHFCLSNSSDNIESIETQTDMTGPGALEVLNTELQDIRKVYASHCQAERLNPSKTIEERMISFQRDCEKRILKDVETQVNYFKENSITKIKSEESKKYNLMLETMRKELETDYNTRVQSHIERENEMTRRMADRERELNQSQYDYRQMMQREIDELRSREESNRRKLELESQGLKILELRLKESQNIIESRERELNRKEQLFDEKSKDINIKSKRESYEQLQCERDQLSLEKMGFIIEKKKFEDERNNQMSLVESANYSKVKLKNCLDQLSEKEVEIDSLKRHIERVKNLKIEEDKQIDAMMSSIDPSIENISKTQQIIKLIQKTSELENKLSLLSDSKKLARSLLDKEEEIKSLQNKLTEESFKNKQKFEQYIKENGLLKSYLVTERSKVSSANLKLNELDKISKEKDATIQSLKKQVISYNPNSKDVLKTTQYHKKTEQSDSDLYNSKLLKDIYNKLYDDQVLVKRMSFIDESNKGLYSNQLLSNIDVNNIQSNINNLQPSNLQSTGSITSNSNKALSNVQIVNSENSHYQNNQYRSQYENSSLDTQHLMDEKINLPINIFLNNNNDTIPNIVPKDVSIIETINKLSIQESTKSFINPELLEKQRFDNEESDYHLQQVQQKQEEMLYEKNMELENQLKIQKEREDVEMALDRQKKLDLEKVEKENKARLEQQRNQEALLILSVENERKQQQQLEEARLQTEREQEEESSRLKKLAEESKSVIRKQQEEREAHEARQRLKIQEEETIKRQKELENQIRLKKLQEEEEHRLAAEKTREEEESRLQVEREAERIRKEEIEREKEEERKSEEDALAIQEARARVLARRKQKQLRDSTESIPSVKSDPDSVKDNAEDEALPVYTSSIYNKQISPNRNLSKTSPKKETLVINESESSDEVQNFEAGNNTMDESDDQWK